MACAMDVAMEQKPEPDVAKAEKAIRAKVQAARRKAALQANMAKRKAVVRVRSADNDKP